MLQQYNPLTIITAGLGLFTALHLSLGWIENKYEIGTKSVTIHLQNRKIKKIENALLACYDLQKNESVDDKLRKCLLKAHKKRFLKERKIRKCQRKYGKSEVL